MEILMAAIAMVMFIIVSSGVIGLLVGYLIEKRGDKKNGEDKKKDEDKKGPDIPQS